MSTELRSTSIEKGRPAFAYEKVSSYLQSETELKVRKEYRAYLRKFPTMVLTNGTGQTLAYFYSKNGTYRIIYGHLQEWMQKVPAMFGGIGKQQLIESVLVMEQEQYRMATKQMLNLVSWMSRFADGLIDEDGKILTEREGAGD